MVHDPLVCVSNVGSKENSSIVIDVPEHTPVPGRQYRKERVSEFDATVHLSLPADPGSISVVRAVVASVASRLALAYDSVDDLRIAAAEAAAMLLSDGGDGAAQLCVDLVPDETGLRLTIWVEGPGRAPDLSDREGLAWRVIEGLSDEAIVREVEGGSSGIELLLRAVPQ
jgi:anti-sigma regulatory factor (Ser/Thr protein kinase)